ncbi:MAG: hypothetical protein MJ178_05925 [Treponemataceae bacterium]|nr:hypothetical protein [Treponemataceae bacterium]
MKTQTKSERPARPHNTPDTHRKPAPKPQPLFARLPKESQEILQNFDQLVQDIQPLNAKQLQQLPDVIKELSHSLTDERNSRRIGYMNETRQLSAYTRYFTWWNLVRMTPLFTGFPAAAFAHLTDDSVILDIGSGPLTVVMALWLARPELRTKEITCYCLDISQNALALGEELFLKVVSKTAPATPDQKPWHIVRVKGESGTAIRRKAQLITCANMFNEQYWNSEKPLEEIAKKDCELLMSYADEKATMLLIEPGIPRAARFVSLMRAAFIRKKMHIVSPCPHAGECPMEGKKGGKWCHFVLNTEKTAPAKLHKLSDKSGLPKDRASLSFVLASTVTGTENGTDGTAIRVVSDAISLYDRSSARYSCSELGLTLVQAPEAAFSSGDLISVPANHPALEHPQLDRKSGAKKIRLQ